MLVFNLVFVLRFSTVQTRSDLLSRFLPNSTSLFTYELTKGIDVYLEGFSHFKPVFRSIMQSLMFVFLFDYLVSSCFSLVKGGQFIQHLAKVPEISRFDDSKIFIIKIISVSSAFFLFTSLLSFFVFSRKYFLSFIYYTFSNEVQRVDKQEMFLVQRCLVLVVVYPFYFIIQSGNTFLFVYFLYIFKKHIQLIKLNLPENGKFKIINIKFVILKYFSA